MNRGSRSATTLDETTRFVVHADNRGAEALTLPWTTDTNGEARVTFTVSMQPENNYRAGASLLFDAVNQATQSTADAINNKQPASPGAWSGYSVPLTWSPMLTVWRKLHVELDSMEAVSGNLVSSPFTGFVGTWTAVTEITGLNSLDDQSPNLDKDPPGNGRFENGTLLIAGTVGPQPVTGNGNSRVVFPQTSIAGLPFSGKDSDVLSPKETISGTITEVQKSGDSFVWTLNVTASSETPIDWPDFVGGTLSVAGGAEVTITAVGSGLVATSALNSGLGGASDCTRSAFNLYERVA